MTDLMKVEVPENTAFNFSAMDPDDIENLEDEYTQVVIAEDVSPSTSMVRDDLCEARKKIIEACRQSPRSDKIMLRSTMFGSSIIEDHGFKPINNIDETQFKPSTTIGGSTCLYDSIFDSVTSVEQYGRILDNSDIGSNAINFILTDGMENSSSIGHQTILNKIEEIRMNEILESVKIIIIGFNDPGSTYSSDVAQYLENLTKELGLDQYIDVGGMTPKQIAKLVGFISQSISAQSQALGTGGASQNLTF